MTAQGRVETATLAGGCFWCLDGACRDLRGVIAVESGYAGGQTADPTYDQVCTGTTGHAEVVRITYDPNEITFRDLLEVFFRQTEGLEIEEGVAVKVVAEWVEVGEQVADVAVGKDQAGHLCLIGSSF